MLTIFASRTIQPEAEPIDRDPGIISLISALVGLTRRSAGAILARVRPDDRAANDI